MTDHHDEETPCARRGSRSWGRRETGPANCTLMRAGLLAIGIAGPAPATGKTSNDLLGWEGIPRDLDVIEHAARLSGSLDNHG